LYTAGLSAFDEGDRYMVDLMSFDRAMGVKQLRDIKAMEWQFEKLRRCLATNNPWGILIAEFPELESLVSEVGSREGNDGRALQMSITELYRKYVSEWGEFPVRRVLGWKAA